MYQSQIASTRSATAAEGRMLLEKQSGTMCSQPQLGGCNSTCERPIGCTDTTRKAPCCGKSRKKPTPNATSHPALGAFGGFPWLFLVAIITVENISSRGSATRDSIDRRTRRNPSVKRLLPTGAARHHADTLDRYWYCIANRRPSVLCANVRDGSKKRKSSMRAYNFRLAPVVSIGRRNTGVKSLLGFRIPRSWLLVELACHLVQIGLRIHR